MYNFVSQAKTHLQSKQFNNESMKHDSQIQKEKKDYCNLWMNFELDGKINSFYILHTTSNFFLIAILLVR